MLLYLHFEKISTAPKEVSSLILNDLFFFFPSKKVKSVCFLIKPLYSWQALKKALLQQFKFFFLEAQYSDMRKSKSRRQNKHIFQEDSKPTGTFNEWLRDWLLLICANTAQQCTPHAGTHHIAGRCRVGEAENHNRYCSLSPTMALKYIYSPVRVLQVHK